MDLLVLYSVVNEGIINILEHYFEMSRTDGERALNIYRTFTRQTEEVVQFLSVARHYEAHTRLEIPTLKHAPTGLTTSLEEYLNDPDFEVNRRQFLAQQEAKSGSKKSKPFDSKPKTTDNVISAQKPAQAAAPPQIQAPKPAPDLIDFFDSIEQPAQATPQQAPQFNNFQQPQTQQYGFQQSQQTGFQQQPFQQQPSFPPPQSGFQQQQQTGFGQLNQQSTNPFGQPPAQQQPQPLQPNYTGAGFGGYTPQPSNSHFQSNLPSIPQDGVAAFPQQQQMQTGIPQQQPSPAQALQPQSTNPFRQSMLVASNSGTPFSSSSPASMNPNRLSTNPFAKNLQSQPTSSPLSPLPSSFQQQPLQQQSTSPAALVPQRTGTNPFARPKTSPNTAQQTQQPLMPNPTGSTNPFRQSQFINHNTGQGWQAGHQGTMGGFGMDNFDTVPVFPRPGQPA